MHVMIKDNRIDGQTLMNHKNVNNGDGIMAMLTIMITGTAMRMVMIHESIRSTTTITIMIMMAITKMVTIIMMMTRSMAKLMSMTVPSMMMTATSCR